MSKRKPERLMLRLTAGEYAYLTALVQADVAAGGLAGNPHLSELAANLLVRLERLVGL